MGTSDEDFLARLRATFRIEAAEHLQAMATAMLALEKSPDHDVRHRLVEDAFRAAHSLKGAARAVDLTDVESLCQSLEDVFAAWKRQVEAPTPEALDAVHRTLDDINAALAGARADRAPRAGADAPPTPERDTLGVVASEAPAGMAEPGVSIETVRIAVDKLDARVLEAEEMLTVKLAAGRRAEELRDLATRFEAWRKAWAAVQPDVRALRQRLDHSPADADGRLTGTARLLEFLEWQREYVTSLEGTVAMLARTAGHDRQLVGKLVDDLLEDSKKLLLLPFATLAASLPKLVRDLCRDQGKEADLVVHGEEVEIDKRILEAMKAPLIHLLRNCIDHGIETPDERRRAGKPSRGTIRVAASQINGSKVELVVSDDGAGIDTRKVKESAVAHGVLSSAHARQIGDADAQRLTFEPEVSTSPAVTRVSGRGLGLAIVREQTEKLGGSVTVVSQPGRGTQFSMVLPSTLATFRGILVEAAQQLFVIPTFQVERLARIGAREIRTVEGRATIPLGGRPVALVRLADVLELTDTTPSREPSADVTAVVLGAGDQRVAFLIDGALGEREVLVKTLRTPLSRVRNIAGATVLGSGDVVPVLNVSDLLKSARKSGGAVLPAATARPAPAERKSVLVVEDSITSRMLIKGILESAGYHVRTAVDGMEAFALLRTERFDLVVSDVEMPRLNGFDLTAKIRADPGLAELPIVLVTALETREDRERGIDVGANAYIVKSRFDQSSLLDVVRRLA